MDFYQAAMPMPTCTWPEASTASKRPTPTWPFDLVVQKVSIGLKMRRLTGSPVTIADALAASGSGNSSLGTCGDNGREQTRGLFAGHLWVYLRVVHMHVYHSYSRFQSIKLGACPYRGCWFRVGVSPPMWQNLRCYNLSKRWWLLVSRQA